MRALTVSEFLMGVNEVLASVPALIEGELSGFAVRQEKWAFFSLKDENGIIECFMPAWKLRHEVENGMVVRIAGVPRVYEKTGRLRIVVEELAPSGEGGLRRAFALLRAKLEAEGLFDVGRKRAIPRFPERIGLIASTASAAYSDFLRILENRWGGVEVVVWDVRVQGAAAVADVCAALHAAHGVEVVVLTRGGGSLEDLEAFNTEDVARAIFACAVPVVVGVGHERDVTIADLVADVRASTPSNAAERVVPDRMAVLHEVRTFERGCVAAAHHSVAVRAERVAQFVARGAAFVRAHEQRVERDARTLVHAFTASLRAHEHIVSDARQRMASRFTLRRTQWSDRLLATERLLGGLNPARVLARGYSVTTSGGVVVRGAAQLHAGDVLETRFADGRAVSTVTRTE